MGNRRMYFKHGLYDIQMLEEAGFTHLRINRSDGKPMLCTWDVLQAIKNECVGKDRYAVEVFPDEASLVNQTNMRHLWVFPEGEGLPLEPHWTKGYR